MRRQVWLCGIVGLVLGIMSPGAAAKAGPWTKVSSDGDTSVTVPSLVLAGGKVVGSWFRGPAGSWSVEVATFTPDDDAAKLGASVKRVTVTSGWPSMATPLLFGSGSTLRVLIGGVHSFDNADQLNGSSISTRNPDGSWTAPAPTGLFGGATDGAHATAIAAPDGSTPIFLTDYGGGLVGYVGSSGLTHESGKNYAGLLGAPLVEATGATLARDRQGRYWLAWYNSRSDATGVYVVQVDAATGGPAGAAQKAPRSEDVNFGRGMFALACRQTCRVVYHDKSRARLLSWAPGEAGPTGVKGSGNVGTWIAATWRGDGSLSVAWFDKGSNQYKVLFGNKTGANGFVASAGKPTANGIGYVTGLVAVPKSPALRYGGLAVVTNWLGPPEHAYWAKVVPTPPPPKKKRP